MSRPLKLPAYGGQALIEGVLMRGRHAVAAAMRSPQGEIVMKIVPAVNQKVGDKEVPTGIPSTPTQSIPLLETRQTSTVVKVRDGQTILISGLIQEREEEVERAVPYLSGVPVVGPLFRHSTKRRNRSELVLLLTPRLTDVSGPTERVGYRVLPGER